MSRYRLRDPHGDPVTVDAWQFGAGAVEPKWLRDAFDTKRAWVGGGVAPYLGLQGTAARAHEGDWVVHRLHKLLPVPEAQFHLVFEEVAGD